MKTKLDEIIANKSKELISKKKKRDFLSAIKSPRVGDISIIAEIKLASPSGGMLGSVKDIEKLVVSYEKGSADAISVVVDKKYFGGNPEFIRKIKSVVSLPVLAKDFIIDPYQIHEMNTYGADAILLITKILSHRQLKEFVKLSIEIGLEPVVEIQNEKELQSATETDARIIAVNARDLDTFSINIDKACDLLRMIPKRFIRLAFSGVENKANAVKYKETGVSGILIGTSLMRTKNVKGLIKDFKCYEG